MKSKKTLLIGIITLVIITVSLVYLLRPQAKVELILAPSEGTIRINDKSHDAQNGQVLSLKPGTYTIYFSRQNFSTEQVTISLKDKEAKRLVIALTPQTDTARKIISSDPDSSAIIREYQKIKQSELLGKMPLSGVGFVLNSCLSVKNRLSNVPAVCINTDSPKEGEATARQYVQRLGYSLEGMEVLVGEHDRIILRQTESYKVEAYQNDTSDEPTLYITPLNVPYVSSGASHNEQLETIKSSAERELTSEGYKLENYHIIYSNPYLTRYNPDPHSSDDKHDHS